MVRRIVARARRVVRSGRRVARDVARIVFARPATGPAAPPYGIATRLRDYAGAARASLTGDPIRAAERAQRLLATDRELWWPTRIASANSARWGELSIALDATRRLRSAHDSPTLRRREQSLLDRLRETEPGWLPAIPGPATTLESRDERVVMHLLKVSLPDRQSGYTIRSRQTLEAQRAIGLEPFVVTPYGYPPPRPGGPAPDTEVVDGIRHFRLDPGAPVKGVSDIEQLARTAAGAADVARRERPAIVHAASGHRGYEYALVGAAIKAHLGVPLVYEVRGFLEASWTGNPRIAPTAEAAELTRRRLATEARVMDAADAVTTLGSGMRDELVARGVPPDKVVVVPNAIDPERFEPTPADPELRRRYGLEDRWVFGYISNMDHFREGQSVLIEATARLVASGRRVACLLVGDGKLRPALEREAAAAGLGDALVFTGQIPFDAIRDHYALLDAFVVPRMPDRAARFTTPLKPYEAMAMRIPLVVSDLPALTEIADPDRRGLVFPPGDAAALAAVLGRLIDAPDLGQRLGRAARDWVVAERTWAANAARYRDLYAAILDRARVRRSSSNAIPA